MRARLYLILATAGEMESYEKLGFLDRFRKQVEFYSRDFDVTVISSDKKDFSRTLGVQHVRFPLPRIPALKHILYYTFLTLYSLRMKKGVIRVFGVANPTLPIIKLFSRNPIAASYHYDWVDQARAYHNRFKWLMAVLTEKLVIPSIDLLLPTTTRLQKKLRSKYSVKAVTNPNFVDDSIFRPSTRKTRRLIYLGRLHWYKGVDDLLKAVAEYDKDLEVLILGEGSEKQNLTNLAKTLGLTNTNLPGSVKQAELASKLSSSYAMVLPTTLMEGHPKVIIEAFASGTPCIVTDVRGSREVVSDGVNGLVLEPKNVGQLSHAIKTVCDDRDLREMLSKGALRESRTYRMEKVLQREISVLKSLLKAKHA